LGIQLLKMRVSIVLLYLLSILPAPANSQDSTLKNIKFTADFEALARQHLYPPYTSKVIQPGVIRRYRTVTTSLPIDFNTVTDNPFRHGAMFVAVKTTTTYKHQLRLNADVYGEYRGFSYGTFNSENNLVLFPVLSVELRDTIKLGKEKFIGEARIGQFLDERLDEGIMIYNIDLQGSQLKLRHRNSRFTFTIYGDLYNAIGLGADDLSSISYEYLFKGDSARVGISWVAAPPPYAPLKYHSYYNLFGRVKAKKGISVYGQFSFTPFVRDIFEGLQQFHQRIALVAGLDFKIEKKHLHFNNRVETRYYGASYNLFHHDAKLIYRDSANTPEKMYGNTVGAYLYPLRKFDTPFSQWAVFTEYGGHNLGAATVAGELNYNQFKKLGLGFAYDINAIWARLDEAFAAEPDQKRSSFFVYPFFKAAIYYRPLYECSFSLFVTNRSMNLDISYPTSYLNKKPFFGAELYIKI
jgi:hypothetical protein